MNCFFQNFVQNHLKWLLMHHLKQHIKLLQQLNNTCSRTLAIWAMVLTDWLEKQFSSFTFIKLWVSVRPSVHLSARSFDCLSECHFYCSKQKANWKSTARNNSSSSGSSSNVSKQTFYMQILKFFSLFEFCLKSY